MSPFYGLGIYLDAYYESYNAFYLLHKFAGFFYIFFLSMSGL